MPQMKYAFIEAMRREVGMGPEHPVLEVCAAWRDKILNHGGGAYDTARNAGIAAPCSCGAHFATPDGTLFHVALVDVAEFIWTVEHRKIDYRIEATVRRLMAGTLHEGADVLILCRQTCEPFHLNVKREPYAMAHVVKEA